MVEALLSGIVSGEVVGRGPDSKYGALVTTDRLPGGQEDEPAEPLIIFAKKLQFLRLSAGNPSIRSLEKACRALEKPYARSTIQDKLSAQSKPSWEFVLTFRQACEKCARENEITISSAVIDLEAWRAAYQEMLYDLAASSKGARRNSEARQELARSLEADDREEQVSAPSLDELLRVPTHAASRTLSRLPAPQVARLLEELPHSEVEALCFQDDNGLPLGDPKGDWVAQAFSFMDREVAGRLFDMIPSRPAAKLFRVLDEDSAVQIIAQMGRPCAAWLFRRMAKNGDVEMAANLLYESTRQTQIEILSAMGRDDAGKLLRYLGSRYAAEILDGLPAEDSRQITKYLGPVRWTEMQPEDDDS